MSTRRTLWEEGRQTGRGVATLAVLVALVVVVLDVLLSGRISFLFDVTFIAICLTAALSVRPRDFFVVGVLPPLLMLATIVVLAAVARGAVAEPVDSLIQAVVSGLAHHAGALIAGYGLTLVILALRQLAIRNSGKIRSERRPSSRAMS